MKSFVTIVPHIENLELRKDTGQIPYQFHKVLGYDASLVSYYYSIDKGRKGGAVSIPPTDQHSIDKDYPFINTEVRGLKMTFLLNKGRGKFYEKSILEYIKENAKSIDCINFFHFNIENILYSLIYKFYNPTGKVYIKLDIDIAHYRSMKTFINVSGRFGNLKNLLFNKLLLPYFFNKVNLLSAESDAGLEYFKQRFPKSSTKIKLIPNGIDEKRVLDIVGKVLNFKEKENIIISVGRIGNAQKYHEFLLEALCLINLTDWIVYFIGPLEQGFQVYINDFFQQNPTLIGKIVFTGAINNPLELYSYYNKAKIFCMPSRWEGFPLSATEAAYFGNFLLLSDQIFCSNTLTENGLWGDTFPINDCSNLANKLSFYMSSQELLSQKCQGQRHYAVQNLVWQKIIPRIEKYLLNA